MNPCPNCEITLAKLAHVTALNKTVHQHLTEAGEAFAQVTRERDEARDTARAESGLRHKAANENSVTIEALRRETGWWNCAGHGKTDTECKCGAQTAFNLYKNEAANLRAQLTAQRAATAKAEGERDEARMELTLVAQQTGWCINGNKAVFAFAVDLRKDRDSLKAEVVELYGMVKKAVQKRDALATEVARLGALVATRDSDME